MTDILIRTDGQAGRITLNRPQALNALSWGMCSAIHDALDLWADDPSVSLLLIDAAGDRAFCSGGDIAEMYTSGKAGDFDYGRRFWADEYRMNAALARFPKPVVTLLHGFTMGGGVGVGCHGSHRVVCENSQIAMPETAIGLIPDVGGSLLLARAPGRLGEYLATTASRMGPGDAILAEFADYYIPQADWPALIELLTQTGDPSAVDRAAHPAPPSALSDLRPMIDRHFDGERLGDIVIQLRNADDPAAAEALAKLSRNAPLAMACGVELIHRLREGGDIAKALDHEYRFTWRAAEQGDFLEGIRAAIIDKDRSPVWAHADPGRVPLIDVSKMLRPLGPHKLQFERTVS